MNAQELNRRCVELFHHPDAQNHMWHPRMFWETNQVENPKPEDLQRPKVDLRELEVLLSEVTHQPSECADELEREEPGRVSLIRHMTDRGDMPFLHRPH